MTEVSIKNHSIERMASSLFQASYEKKPNAQQSIFQDQEKELYWVQKEAIERFTHIP
jgi:hypothetical protein